MARKFTEFTVSRGPDSLTLPLRITDNGEEFSTTLFKEEIKGATAAGVRAEAQRRYTAVLEVTWDAYYIVRGTSIEAIEMTREEITFAPPDPKFWTGRTHERPKEPRNVRLYRDVLVDKEGMITPKPEAEPREVNYTSDSAKLIPVNDETRRAIVDMVRAIHGVDAELEALRGRRNLIADAFEDRFGLYQGYGVNAKPRHPSRKKGYGADADEVVATCVGVMNALADKMFPWRKA